MPADSVCAKSCRESKVADIQLRAVRPEPEKGFLAERAEWKRDVAEPERA